jgi:hypothetical protein
MRHLELSILRRAHALPLLVSATLVPGAGCEGECDRNTQPLWTDPGTDDRDRKRMVRLLIEDVTLIRDQTIQAHVRFKGGTTRSLSLCRPKCAWMLRQTPSQVVQTVDRLLDDHTDREIANQLNQRGLKPGEARQFHRIIVRRIRHAYHLESRYTRLRKRGMLTLREMARRLRVAPCTVKIWSRAGLLRAHKWDDRGQCLFELPAQDAPVKHQRKQLAKRLKSHRKSHRSNP